MAISSRLRLSPSSRPSAAARSVLLASALALTVGACSGPADDAAPASDAGAGDSESVAAESASAEETSDAAADADAALTITLGSESIDFAPTIATCESGGGEVRSIVLSMDDGQLPLVKVVPGEFAMVKLDDSGEPEKSTTGVDGVSVEDGVVTFDEVVIGDAVVDGSVPCTSHGDG